MVFQPSSQVLSHGISELVRSDVILLGTKWWRRQISAILFQSTINPNCSSHIFLWKQTFVDVSLFKTKLRAKIFLKEMIMSFVTWDEKGFLYQWLCA